EDGIRDFHVTGVQTCALPISSRIAADKLSELEQNIQLQLLERTGRNSGQAPEQQAQELKRLYRDMPRSARESVPVVKRYIELLRSEERRVGKCGDTVRSVGA